MVVNLLFGCWLIDNPDRYAIQIIENIDGCVILSLDLGGCTSYHPGQCR